MAYLAGPAVCVPFNETWRTLRVLRREAFLPLIGLDFVAVGVEGEDAEDDAVDETPEVLAMTVLCPVLPSAAPAVKENKKAILTAVLVTWFAVYSLFINSTEWPRTWSRIVPRTIPYTTFLIQV
jgi:hypothetical protein